MSRVILISDLDTDLGNQLLKKYYSQGYKIVGFVNKNSALFSQKEYNSEYLEVINWNRTSPVGVKNVLLQGVTRFKQIDGAIILQTGSLASGPLEGIPVAEINRHVDSWIKGNFILLKELLYYFGGRVAGTLTLVNNLTFPADSTGGSPLYDVLEGTFEILLKHLFKANRDKPVIVNGVKASTTSLEKLAEYVYKITTEKSGRGSGKLYHFSVRKNLLSGFRS